MYGKLSFPGERGSGPWPFPEPAASPPDGPLAVISAVLATARRHKLRFALWMLVCLGTAAAYAFTATPFYTATATLLFEPRRQAAQSGSDAMVASSFDVSRAEGELQVLRSERLLAHVFNSLNLVDDPEFKPQPPGLLGGLRNAVFGAITYILDLEPAAPPNQRDAQQLIFENFAQRVNVRRVGQSFVAEISYTAQDPTLARRIANAAASAYLWQSVATKADAAKNGAEFLLGRQNALITQARSAAAAVAAGTLPDAPMSDADARIIGAALQPLRPSAPRKALILALGGMVGLIGGFMGVALAQAFDRRIRTAQDVVQHTALPCLAVLPEMDRRSGFIWRRRGAGAAALAAPLGRSAFAMGIRELRTSIQLAAVGRAGDVVVALVGCAPGVGTSVIGLQLARLIRDSGRPVTLIDGNVHGASAWPPAGHGPHRGTCLAELLDDSTRLTKGPLLDRGGIAVVPARSPDRVLNERAYLGAPALHQIIEQLRQSSVVILDLPPFSVAAEARAAARRADVVVIVAAAGRTTVDQLGDAATSLRSAGANVIGVVVNHG